MILRVRLVYQMTSARTFTEAMKLAQEGDASTVDLLVKDIYGHDAEAVLGIPGDITASSFGRLTRPKSGNSEPSESAIAASACVLMSWGPTWRILAEPTELGT